MNSISSILTVDDLSFKLNGQLILDKIGFSVKENEHWAITGASGSGKTTLAQALVGRNVHTGRVSYHFDGGMPGAVLLVEQQHHFRNRSNTSNFYYQQRFNSIDSGDSLTVEEYIRSSVDTDAVVMTTLLDQLHIAPLLEKPLIQLSNGENKRLQLAVAVLKSPAMLILDNPFTGLDVEGRKTLHAIIDTISGKGIHVMLIVNASELSSSITHVLELDEGRISFKGLREEYEQSVKNRAVAISKIDMSVLNKLTAFDAGGFETAIQMKNVSIRYGDRTIIDKLNWEVKKGERWSISGPNGAGKSTLLSLINGDNPQAYANEIYLFDRRRGTGESIWDIKKHIGYLSPELHLFFDSSNTCWEMIASGLFDTIGLFRQVSDEQQARVNLVIDALRLEEVSNKRLFQMSLGQQRLSLLGRALVKNPPLLILDEPCQGLDDRQSECIKGLIDAICSTGETTLLYVSHYERDVPSCVDRYLRL
jgi:molybdate transport system ATP-binding protein